MKQLFKTFKPWDFLFIGIALVLSFTPLFITTFIYTDKVDAPVAIIKIDGEEVDRFILSEDAGHIEKLIIRMRESIILLNKTENTLETKKIIHLTK